MAITDNQRIVALARQIVAWPNRRRWLTFASGPLMRGLARFAMRRVGTKPANDLEQLYQEWQRASPALASYRLTEIRDDTIHAEIHSQCALRGTGDVAACHRMMEYDREVLRKAGGELVVVASQATPGRTYCTVALRRAGASMADLTPAHERQET